MTSVSQPKDKAESTKVPVPPASQAIVDAKDRTDADRQLDAGRHPGELLTFLGLRPGMRVAELAAGSGYTTELLARAVGPTGKVWANEALFIDFGARRFDFEAITKQRLEKSKPEANRSSLRDARSVSRRHWRGSGPAQCWL
jgi:predicted methyltransferase